MKAIIMAAGKGIRMLPLTKTIPKVLIKINGKPFLYYIIQNLKKAGFLELGIIAGHLKEMIEQFITDYNIDAEIIEQKEQLGTGHAIMQVKDFCRNENFIVLGGDNLWSSEDFIAIPKNDDLNYVFGVYSDSPEKYGVLAKDRDDNLIEIKEKPEEYVGSIINTGLYKFTPEIFAALQEIKKSERDEYELTDAINILASQKKVKVIKIKNYWLDLSSIEDIKKIEDFLKRVEPSEL